MPRLFYIFILFTLFSFARTPAGPPLPPGDPVNGHDLTVSYSIELKSKKRNSGIGETYNGGVETIFAGDQQIRLRLVSLMRMESIFILPDHKPQQRVIILKESGKNKYKCYLTAADWKLYNQKYEGVTCRFSNDTVRILNYTCKKAILTLKSGKTITVYYTPAIQKPALSDIEPLFSSIPGLVMKYEYAYRKGTIIYMATIVNRNSIDPDVFAIPGNEFPLKKYEVK
jgi:GLPGLI family protein